MNWTTQGNLSFKCVFANGYTAVVRAKAKTPSWTVYLNDKKIKSGKKTHAIDAMSDATAFVNSKLGDNDDTHQENKNN